MEILKEARPYTVHHLDCFHTGSIINTLVIKSLEFKRLLLFHLSFPYVSSTLFDNKTQCLFDFQIVCTQFFFVRWVLLNS